MDKTRVKCLVFRIHRVFLTTVAYPEPKASWMNFTVAVKTVMVPVYWETDKMSPGQNVPRTKCPWTKCPPHTGTKCPMPGFYNKFMYSVFPVKVCLFFVGMNKKLRFTAKISAKIFAKRILKVNPYLTFGAGEPGTPVLRPQFGPNAQPPTDLMAEEI